MPPTRDLATLRLGVAAAAAGSYVLTWPLWQSRAEPPHLPLLPLPLPFGLLLLATLALALWRPRPGTLLHAGLLALAMLADQLRLQPQALSFAVLLFATAPVRGAAQVGALHLTALWFWSGLGKLVSPDFLREGGAFLLGIEPGAHPVLATAVAAALGLFELLLAVLAAVPRTQPFAARVGASFHLVIFVWLALVRDTNVAVWPWNLALAASAWVLLGAARGPLLGDRATAGPLPRAFAALAVVLPLGYHAGFVDAPFAQQVYVQNGPRATWLRADGRVEPVGLVPGLGVFVPPVPRIQAAWFAAVAQPGDRMAIEERRPLAKLCGRGDRLLRLAD